MARINSRNLANRLIKEVASCDNLKHAFRSVKRNKGAPGVDNVSVDEVADNLEEHLNTLHDQLMAGNFRPLPAKYVEIPKPDQGVRILGIPTVTDRWVAQAIVQVLSPIVDPSFSDSSFGFRPKRNAKQAIEQAKRFVEQGREYSVDIDLEQFFDCVNQDKLMSLTASTTKTC